MPSKAQVPPIWRTNARRTEFISAKPAPGQSRRLEFSRFRGNTPGTELLGFSRLALSLNSSIFRVTNGAWASGTAVILSEIDGGRSRGSLAGSGIFRGIPMRRRRAEKFTSARAPVVSSPPHSGPPSSALRPPPPSSLFLVFFSRPHLRSPPPPPLPPRRIFCSFPFSDPVGGRVRPFFDSAARQ